MEYDSETQRKIAKHFAIAAALSRVVNDLLPIELMIRDDVVFFEEWMKSRADSDKEAFSGNAPAEAMLKLLKGARDTVAAHRELLEIGEFLMSGTEDTGKYKM